MWNFYFQSIIFAVILAGFLAISVLKKNPNRQLNRIYLIPASLFILSNITTFLSAANSILFNLNRGFYLFLPIGTVHFILVYLRIRKVKEWNILRIFYAISAFLFLVSLKGKSDFQWIRYVIALYYVPILFFGYKNLYQQYQRSVSRVERYQIIYLVLGTIAWVLGGFVDFLQLKEYSIYPLGVLGGVTFLAIAAWSIIKFRLLDISVLTGKVIVYFILILLLLIFYFLFTKSWPDTFFSQTLKIILAVILLLMIYEPITRKVESWSNKIIQHERHQFISKMTDLNKMLVNIIDSKQVFQIVLMTFADTEKISNAALFIRDGVDGDFYQIHSVYFPSNRLEIIEKDKPIIEFLSSRKEIIVKDEIERAIQMGQFSERKKSLLATFRTLVVLDADICIPISFQNRTKGFISLKNRDTSLTLNKTEREMLLHLADQIGIITENSRLYLMMKKKDRLAALGQMSSGLAHEIRNPLGALKATAQHLETAEINTELHEFLEIIVEEVNRLNDVVTRFLSFAHPLKLESSKVNLNALIQRTLNLIRNQKTWDSIQFNIDLQPDLPLVLIDENQIKQVLLNLILNAEQAMKGKGNILLKTVFIEKSARIIRDKAIEKKKNEKFLPLKYRKVLKSISSGKKGVVELSIEDTGEGIAEENLDKIFTPFFTMKEDGSGLGLAIAYRIIEAHEAGIDVFSRLEHGTRFTIQFPINEG